MTRINISALAVTLVLASSASAQMYQYTDRNGNVVFTDRPPAGSHVDEVKLNNDRVFRSAPRRSEPSIRTSAPVEPERRKRDYSEVTAIMYMTNW